MDKFYTGYCVGECGEWLTEDSSFVDVLDGELLCHYCRDKNTGIAALQLIESKY